MLFLRPLDSLIARPILESGDARTAIWSPDSRAIAFVAGNRLKRGLVEGPANAETIATLDFKLPGPGGTWNTDGDILIGGAPGIVRVNTKTGKVTQATAIEGTVNRHAWPVFLPGGRLFLYSAMSMEGTKVHLGDLDSGKSMYLFTGERRPYAYVPGPQPGMGFVIGVHESALTARRLDSQARTVQGAVLVLDPTEGNWDGISASRTGVVAARRQTDGSPTPVKWLDRTGRTFGEAGEPGIWGEVQLTRKANYAVLSLLGPPRRIRVLDLGRGVMSPLDPTMAASYPPTVSPDDRIAFTGTNAKGGADIYLKPINSADAAAQLLYASPKWKHPNDWSHDGRFLLYDDHDPVNRQDLWILPLEGDRKPYPFLATAADETLAQFSPDGKWIAYQSDEAGRYEIYVQAFSPSASGAASGAKWQVSNGGGTQPRWRRDGKETYYYNQGSSKMMAVPIRPGGSFSPGAPAPLFDIDLLASGGFSYDVTADGSRFLVNRTVNETVESRVTVLTNVLPALMRQAIE
jgi:Tol biopolymer transport system component